MKKVGFSAVAAMVLATNVQALEERVVSAPNGSLTGVKKIAPKDLSVYDRDADPHTFTVFMKQGGWCWYQDPRAILHAGKLFMGSVQGNGTGAALVGVYDMETHQPLGTRVMQDHFERDDHNSPVFYARPDGSVLAVYAKHHREACFYTRISNPNDPLEWGDETKVVASAPVTYANLYELKKEGKLYNFFRCIQWNPTFVTSTDGGKTWSEETHFIASELNGTHRPYCRYASNGEDTIYISFTDGHPRQFGNSIYYAEFRDGKFWRADGTLIKDLAKDGPLRPSDAEKIFQGSGGGGGRGTGRSALNAAWTSSIVVDGRGYPHMGYTLYVSDADRRYRLASWDGKKWNDREVARAGTQLFNTESSYTGLITLDPVDPAYVVISTDVEPSTGKDLGGLHEIYRAKIGSNDDISTIKWEAVTSHSTVRNIRPLVLRHGSTRVVLWLRGRFTTFLDYDLDAVGFVE